MKHIFLTGEKQVGKTTILNKALSNLNIPITGFKTCWKGDKLYIVDVSQSEHKLIAQKTKNGLITYTDIFNSFGISIIKNTYNKPLTVFDEFGFIESTSTHFTSEVLKRLDNTSQILGVIRKAENAFLNDIKNHTNVTVIEVTELNRDTVFNDIIENLNI